MKNLLKAASILASVVTIASCDFYEDVETNHVFGYDVAYSALPLEVSKETQKEQAARLTEIEDYLKQTIETDKTFTVYGKLTDVMNEAQRIHEQKMKTLEEKLGDVFKLMKPNEVMIIALDRLDKGTKYLVAYTNITCPEPEKD